MSDFNQRPLAGEKRNTPIWQVFGVVIVLMSVAVGSFMVGKKHPAPGYSSSYDTSGYSSDGTSTDTSGDTSSSTGSNYSNSSSAVQTTQYVTLQSLIGYGSSSVERAIRSSGLRVFTRYTNGDPSISARLNDGCSVVDQSPAAGSVISVGSTVTILADCPMTGQG